MAKKWIYIISGISVVVMAAFFLHWFYFTNPEALPANEKLVSEINRVFPEAVASTIQDTVSIDNKHVFVPFITENNEYGISFWAWKRHEWKVLRLDTAGASVLWKVNKNDPSSYHFVWNIHPDDQISYLKFYVVRDRGFGGYNNIYNYTPRIQMDKKVMLEEKSYGVLKVPEDWLSVMKPIQKVEQGNLRTTLSSIFPREGMYFGYTAYNEADEDSSITNSVNGRGYGNKGIDTEHLRHLDESQLEMSMKSKLTYTEKVKTKMGYTMSDIETRILPWIEQKDYDAVYKLQSGPMSDLEKVITYMKQADVPEPFSSAHQKLLNSMEAFDNLVATHREYESITDEYLKRYKEHYQDMSLAFKDWKVATSTVRNSSN